MRKMYPLILLFEVIVVPLFLSIESMFQVGIYIVLFLEILVTVYVSLVPLYPFSKSNLRNYAHRAIVLSICLLQTVTLSLKNSDLFKALLFWQPISLLALLLMGFICTGLYTIFQCI